MIFDLLAFTQSLPVNASFHIQNCSDRGLERVSRWTCHTTSQLCRATGPLNPALLLIISEDASFKFKRQVCRHEA